MSGDFVWLHRPPNINNLRVHPGMRCKSRIHSIPTPYRRVKGIYSEEQIKLVRGGEKAEKQELILLNECKNLFSRQLPCMGSYYISRLVFDFNSETVAVLSKGIVVGSITARLFFKEEFVEIAFLAVDSNQQGKNYGRLVMLYFKQCLQAYPFHDVLACADKDAVEFFKKLGFNMDEILMDPDRYLKRIKDYTGVKLVYCNIMSEIDYMNSGNFIKKQIKYLENKVGKHFFTFPDVIYDPYKRYQKQPSTNTVPLKDVVKDINPEQYDEELEATLKSYRPKMDEVRNKCLSIMRELMSDYEFSEWFEAPVTEEIAAFYFDKIKYPMDFRTIFRRLQRNPDFYKRPDMLYADLKQIVENCQIYNSKDSDVYRLSNALKKKTKILFEKYFPDFVLP